MSRIFTSIFLCLLLGCDTKRTEIVQPEDEIERLFSELVEAFAEGNDKKAAAYFISPITDDITPEAAEELSKLVQEDTRRIGKAIRGLPSGVRSRGSKVIGNIGVILVETEPGGTLEPMYLRQTKAGWKFESGLVTSNFLIEWDILESPSDYEDNEKINAWIEQQTKKANKAEMATPRKPSD